MIAEKAADMILQASAGESSDMDGTCTHRIRSCCMMIFLIINMSVEC